MPNLHIQSLITQAFSRLPHSLTKQSLQGRFLLIMGASSIILSLLFFAIFNNFTEHLLARIGARFAVEQSLFDKARSLQPMLGEMALARGIRSKPSHQRVGGKRTQPGTAPENYRNPAQPLS